MGKPLISTEVGTGTSHVNIDKETGLVVSPGSIKELREAMDYLHNNPEEARRMGERSRVRYGQYFTGEIIGNQYMNLYRSIIEGEV